MTTDPLVLPAQTIFGVLQNQAERHPRKVAIEFHDREITYAETAERARRFASALTRLGVSKGDKVGIMLPNLPEFLFAYYGALAAGATVVLFNVMLKPGEIEYLCSHSETKVMVVLDRLYPAAAEGIKNAPSVREMIVIGESIPQTHSFGGLIESGDPGFTPPPIDLRDLAHLIYTSGTTGKPKGAMITHFNVLSNLASMNLMRPTIESTKVLCVLPLFHAYGLISVMSGTVMRGGTVFLHPRFEAGPVIEALKTKGITGFAGTPTMYFHILNHPASQGAKFPTLTRAGSGGAALPIEIRTAFRERFGVDVTEGYGMSETTVSACGYPEGLPPKAGSVGIPIPGTEMRVVDEAGKDVRIGEIGEIVCKGPNIMTGYYKNPEATAEALRDGWLYTGDLGYVDEKGYFSIVDRKKDMIIKGGYNIYPREIEEVIYELPEVNMAAVIGVPDLGKGEIPHALISVKPGMTLDPQKVMDRLGEKLAKYKLPESVRIVSEIPTGPTGKILKRELRAKWNEISGGAI